MLVTVLLVLSLLHSCHGQEGSTTSSVDGANEARYPAEATKYLSGNGLHASEPGSGIFDESSDDATNERAAIDIKSTASNDARVISSIDEAPSAGVNDTYTFLMNGAKGRPSLKKWDGKEPGDTEEMTKEERVRRVCRFSTSPLCQLVRVLFNRVS